MCKLYHCASMEITNHEQSKKNSNFIKSGIGCRYVKLKSKILCFKKNVIPYINMIKSI